MQEQSDFEYQNSGQNFDGNVNYYQYGVDPQEKEKKEIKKSAWAVCLAGLFLLFFAFFFRTQIGLILGFAGLSYEKIVALLSDPFIGEIMQIFFSLTMFTVPFIVTFKICGYSISETVALKKPCRHDFLPLILIGVGFCAFADLAVAMAGDLFSSFGVDYSVDFGENPEGFFGFAISFISTAIVPALVEEFACRGIVLGALRKFGDGFAIIVSSVFFGLMHGNFEQMPFAFLVGLVLAYITLKSGSIVISCIVHGINNSISVISDYFLSGISSNVRGAFYCAYLALALAAAIFGAYIYGKKNTDALTLTNVDMKSSEKQKLLYFLSSPATVIFIAVCLIQAFSYF